MTPSENAGLFGSDGHPCLVPLSNLFPLISLGCVILVAFKEPLPFLVMFFFCIAGRISCLIISLFYYVLVFTLEDIKHKGPGMVGSFLVERD